MKGNVLILFSCIVFLSSACSNKVMTSNGSILYNPEQDSVNNSKANDFLDDNSITSISDVKKNRWEYNRDLNDIRFDKQNNDIQKNDSSKEVKKLEDAIQKSYNKEENKQINNKRGIERIDENKIKSGLYIQAGLYNQSSGSKKIENKILNSGINNVKILVENGQNRIVIGPYKNKNEADAVMEKLENIGINDYFWIKR